MVFGSYTAIFATVVFVAISQLFLPIELTECRTDTLSPAMMQCKHKFIYELGRYCSSNPRNRKRNIRLGSDAREADYLADLLGRPSTAEKENQNPENQLGEGNKSSTNITELNGPTRPRPSPAYLGQHLQQNPQQIQGQNLYQGTAQNPGFEQWYPLTQQNVWKIPAAQLEPIGQYEQGYQQGSYPRSNQWFPSKQYPQQASGPPLAQFAPRVSNPEQFFPQSQDLPLPFSQSLGQAQGVPLEFNQYPQMTQGIPQGGEAGTPVQMQHMVAPPSQDDGYGNTQQHTRSRRVKRMYDPDVALVSKCCRRPPGCYAQELAKLPKSFYANICGA